MANKKRIRDKGKIKLSEYFKKLADGDKVAVKIEKTVCARFPKRIRGLTGEVVGTRGTHKLVKLKDKNKLKTFIIHPIHLRKL
jgi:large subunit ribosomal protein L21e